MKKIAVLTSGGDAPGMNACIRAITKYCLNQNMECIGILDGFDGLIKQRSTNLNYDDVNNIIQKGGTILGSARSKEFQTKEGRKQAFEYLQQLAVEGMIVIGGNGSLTGAKIFGDEFNVPIIGIPGTIDNDIFGTDHTIGYDTAVNTVIEAVDKIRDTASSHKRVFFVEVMGRDSGFIALNAAIASGAESVLIPEEVTDIQALVENIKEFNKGKRGSIIIVAEGDDAGDALTIMKKVKPFLPDYDLRTTVLGHLQRGGNPSAYDRIIASRMGIKAVELLVENQTNLYIATKGGKIITQPIDYATQKSGAPNASKLEVIEQLRTKK
ncbi:MAG: 6-phosphofructokinase [Crocinitomicaceae bacterium]|nr:6-phosphofructokinase [Crocinitomicaceae bacterium]